MSVSIHFAHFFAGIFLVNGFPHFLNGISGKRYPTPFASPPNVGESSPIVNVLWGSANFMISFLLIFGMDSFKLGLNADTIAFAIGAAFMAVILSWHFERAHLQS